MWCSIDAYMCHYVLETVATVEYYFCNFWQVSSHKLFFTSIVLSCMSIFQILSYSFLVHCESVTHYSPVMPYGDIDLGQHGLNPLQVFGSNTFKITTSAPSSQWFIWKILILTWKLPWWCTVDGTLIERNSSVCKCCEQKRILVVFFIHELMFCYEKKTEASIVIAYNGLDFLPLYELCTTHSVHFCFMWNLDIFLSSN